MDCSGPVLGINVSHDRSAVLSRDGVVLCGIAEERLDRRKHSVAVADDGSYLKTLPQQAIDYVLSSQKIKITDCSAIMVCGSVVYHPEKPLRNLTVDDVLAQLPGDVDGKRVHVIEHHLAHAVGAYMASTFDEAAILVADGAGNLLPETRGSKRLIPTVEHTTFYHAQGAAIREVGKIASEPRAMNSLGAMYQLVTLFCGFGLFQEGKTMGLAPYGTDALAAEFDGYIDFPAPLRYRIDPLLQTFDVRGRQIPAAFVRRFGQPRHYSEPLRQIDKDLAFAVQHALEQTLIHLAKDLRETTGSANLVLAGGVALNSVANQKIAEQAGFEKVFIVPCAADDGTALGAALWPWLVDGRKKSWSMQHAYLGRTYNEDEYEEALQEQKNVIQWNRPDDLTDQVAQHLADGAIVGRHQGRAEIGPRALGNRSILCDPRQAENKNRLNEKVKYRESFRPFAPAVTAENAETFFELQAPSPFMLRVAKGKKPDTIPAATHVDGTGRVQTVTREANEAFYDLLTTFDRLTGVPVLLNTSFNLAGDPIVETPADAIDCFLKSEIDFLVLGPFLVEKKNPELCHELARKHRELADARLRIAAQEAELEAIRGSRGWRLLNWLNRLRRF